MESNQIKTNQINFFKNMFRIYQYCKFMRFVVEKVKLLMKIGFDCIIKLHYYLNVLFILKLRSL